MASKPLRWITCDRWLENSYYQIFCGELSFYVSEALIPRSGWVDGSVGPADQRFAAVQAHGVSSASRRFGQLLTSFVSTSVK